MKADMVLKHKKWNLNKKDTRKKGRGKLSGLREE
jgi:hypothetical protein